MRYAVCVSRTWIFVVLLLVGCKPDIERATGSVGVGSGFGPGSGSGGAGGEGGAGGAAGAGGGCQTDSQCQPGAEWCVGGSCLPCDNSGTVCDISCPEGWTTYQRNGCHACACAPPNQCTANADCGAGAMQCYPGNFCWDWCPPNDPSCCFGNICDVSGCGPNPTGCFVTGCPAGQTCIEAECTSALCQCDGAAWMCGSDCLGGICT